MAAGSSTVGIELPRGIDPLRLVLGQLLLADLEDLVGIEPVERTEGDQLVVGIPTQLPVVDGGCERLAQEALVLLDRLLRAVARARQALEVLLREHALGRARSR